MDSLLAEMGCCCHHHTLREYFWGWGQTKGENPVLEVMTQHLEAKTLSMCLVYGLLGSVECLHPHPQSVPRLN